MKRVSSQKAFTLIELLVVMGIMGLLGTIAVGGYRAMTRGMEERGVMQSVNSFVRTAYQRAQIDRQPVVIYLWNETLRSSTELQNEIVVGKAVAIRRYGRFSAVGNNKLVDEFADLNLTYQKQENADAGSAGSSKEASFFIYPLESLDDLESNTTLKRTLVEGKVADSSESVRFLTKDRNETIVGEENVAKIPSFGFVIQDAGGITWKAGMAYGMEFMHLELPHNYIFGSQHSGSADNPIVTAGTLVFDVGVSTGSGLITGGSSGRNTVEISSLRPDGSGGLRAQKVAVSANPEEDLK